MGKQIAVIGAGAWGSTIAKVVAGNGHQVRLWCYLEEEVSSINQATALRLPGIQLPKGIQASQDLNEVLVGADYCIVALSSTQLDLLLTVDKDVFKETPIIVLTKGFLDIPGEFFVVDYLKRVLSTDQVMILSGPNLALEIAREKIAASVIASEKTDLLLPVQELLSNHYFRVYGSSDVKGVALGGVLKNVVAIAAGLCDGLEMGTNAKSALLARGLQEMCKIGDVLGANRETFFGLSGLGDLVTTCSSSLSRNWQFGEQLSKGRKASEIISSLQQVTEGVRTSKVVSELIKTHQLELPIMSGIYQIIYEEAEPKDVLYGLMTRTLKLES
ncbi:glycerol-3-phosphate dehydrogenase [Candidatus Marinamargulisbacteria bacterium SCGC AG-439-L15]|nr:glycerol-3-phosphate dehydrogenase [Candidatus Marinamargulisbacteria bacterium SCGC AG-439-L15]